MREIDATDLNTKRHQATPGDWGRLRTGCVLVRQTYCPPSDLV